MKISNSTLPLCIGLTLLLVAAMAPAQTFTTLHSFTNSPDGGYPNSGLTLSGSTLYGTTPSGGTPNYGTVFKVNTDGSGYTVLKSFIPDSDGGYPGAGLTLSGNTLYGTTVYGGNSSASNSSEGTLFKMNTDGSNYIVLKNFTYPVGVISGNDGLHPSAGLTLSGGTLYGTTQFGGSSSILGAGYGTVFKMNTDGLGYTVLRNFTNSPDGQIPMAGLTLSGSTLYGTTQTGGSSNSGTVFKVNTGGSGYTVLKSFNGGSDGALPQGGLTLSGSTLYGTTESGGSSSLGTVFKLNTDGSDFTVLKHFTTDGRNPIGDLTLSGSTLYGTTQHGASPGQGTVFKLNTDGSGYTVLKYFTNSLDGQNPIGSLTLSGSTLYGTTKYGGSSGLGTVFALSLAAPPQLAGSGVQAGTFGFTITGASNQTVVVEAGTNLVNWQPIWTNTLSGTSTNFTDAQWTNYPYRFYRAQ